MPSKKFLLVLLFFIPSTVSFLRLFRITIYTKPSSTLPPPSPTSTSPITCSSPPSNSVKDVPHVSYALRHHVVSPVADSLTPKEIHLLSSLISLRSPCNILFFGLNPQFLALSRLNVRGNTVFLEGSVERLDTAFPEFQSVRFYNVKYNAIASKAYEMLKGARTDPACTPKAGPLQSSSCQLALTRLPKEIYELKWDVIVVDGPSGDRPEALGRMPVIYSASMMARSGEITDVLVHDVDRTIEKWYSWEFLCHDNLVASKGKLWHFRIHGNSTLSGFCSESKIGNI